MTKTAVGLTIEDLLPSFVLSLRAERKAAKTITAYTDAAERFARWLASEGHSTVVTEVTKADVQRWIVSQQEEGRSPSTVAGRFRYLQQWWRWVAAEDEVAKSPMTGMSPPSIPERPVPVYTSDELAALLKATAGKDFDALRDRALLRIFMATGARLGEVAGMTMEAIDHEGQAVLVVGKGDRGRWVPFDTDAALALDRYLRARMRHPLRNLPALWIGKRGPLTSSGITQVLRRRAAVAGVKDVRPHRFRHTFAHHALSAGMAEGNLQELAGWRSPQMLARYGSSARGERARASYQSLDLYPEVKS